MHEPPEEEKQACQVLGSRLMCGLTKPGMREAYGTCSLTSVTLGEGKKACSRRVPAVSHKQVGPAEDHLTDKQMSVMLDCLLGRFLTLRGQSASFYSHKKYIFKNFIHFCKNIFYLCV